MLQSIRRAGGHLEQFSSSWPNVYATRQIRTPLRSERARLPVLPKCEHRTKRCAIRLAYSGSTGKNNALCGGAPGCQMSATSALCREPDPHILIRPGKGARNGSSRIRGILVSFTADLGASPVDWTAINPAVCDSHDLAHPIGHTILVTDPGTREARRNPSVGPMCGRRLHGVDRPMPRRDGWCTSRWSGP